MTFPIPNQEQPIKKRSAMPYALGISFLIGTAVSLYLMSEASLRPHEGLGATILMVPYFAFCPGNVLTIVGLGFPIFGEARDFVGAFPNGSIYALVAYGVGKIPVQLRWIRPIVVLAALGLSFGFGSLF